MSWRRGWRGGAEFGAGAEQDAGLEDIERGKVERGEFAFEFAFDAEVEVRGVGVGADGGDEVVVSRAMAASPLGEAEGNLVVDAAEGFGRAGGFAGGAEGVQEGGGGWEGIEVFEIGDGFNEMGVGEAGGAGDGGEEESRLGGGVHWLLSLRGMRSCAWIFLALPLLAEKERLSGGRVLPHDRYVHAVSLADPKTVFMSRRRSASRRAPGPSPCWSISTVRRAAGAWRS